MTTENEPYLVFNSFSGNHLEALKNVIGRATKISIAVAFLKSKGLNKIVRELQERLMAGAEVEIVVGRDFCLTEPGALRVLFDLSERHPSLDVFVAKTIRGQTFHPKIYLGSDASEARALIGSANLTGGALSTNEEISLAWTLPIGAPLFAQLEDVFANYRSKGISEELDSIVLERYKRAFEIAQDAKKRVDKEISNSDAAMFDLATFSTLHKEFLQDRGEIIALKKRRNDRKSARLVQIKIAKMAEIKALSRSDRNEFMNMFKDLVTSGGGHRHLWHSGDIHRRGQAALTKPRKTIKLFALAMTASKLEPKDGYASLRPLAKKIDGVGINMVSEMLCTFAPKRYAVFNGNTCAALRVIGADPPRTITLFSPDSYGRICDVVEAVRRRIGGDDLSEVDAFLNWIYQTKVKNIAER